MRFSSLWLLNMGVVVYINVSKDLKSYSRKLKMRASPPDWSDHSSTLFCYLLMEHRMIDLRDRRNGQVHFRVHVFLQ
jgi:hypothetical protein